MSEFKSGLSTIQFKLIKLFCGKRPTLYYPILNRVFGWQLGLLLSQLAYWSGRGRDKRGWIYKTAIDLREETGLTFANQKTAIRKGLELKVIEVGYFKVPRRRHYKVDWNRVAEIVVLKAPSLGLVVSKELMELGHSKPTTTEITQKTTSKRKPSDNQAGSILFKMYPKFLKRKPKND